MKSIVQPRGRVPFPAHLGERVYMREFRRSNGLPFDLRCWQPTVDAMLDGIEADGPIYLMVDQGRITAGKPHRRPGLHIDGYWIPELQAHGGRPPGHIHTAAKWEINPGWNTGGSDTEWPPEAILLASDVSACRAMVGEWSGAAREGGDCRHIDTSGMNEIVMDAGIAYAGNVTMLHESLPVPADCLRTVVRLNVPGWHPAG